MWRGKFLFTLILKKDVEEPQVQALRIKLDPGSKTTGIAIANDASGELVKFDLQKMENPEITGVQYQHGYAYVK